MQPAQFFIIITSSPNLFFGTPPFLAAWLEMVVFHF
jgi:hypothetical protein